MQKDQIEEAISLAQDAAASASPELKEKAFEVVLAHLLGGSRNVPVAPTTRQPQHDKGSADSGEHVFDFANVAARLKITEEQARELYQIKNGILHMNIAPVGANLVEKQQNLANVLVVGYRFGLDAKEVSITAINDAADEWTVRDSNLGRSLKTGGTLQMKGGGKGKRPVFSLAPKALEQVTADIAGMFA
jgi:hypothetical protein